MKNPVAIAKDNKRFEKISINIACMGTEALRADREKELLVGSIACLSTSKPDAVATAVTGRNDFNKSSYYKDLYKREEETTQKFIDYIKKHVK
ncbi:MAG: hypothetical protein L7F78_17650 [Syntrophales bacterium LBB04]|nr:hypothetical protein [Syntrophales bacterium LBB04]